MVKEIFMIKETLLRNLGLVIKTSFVVILFCIGLGAINNAPDQLTILFMTLIWCYIFLCKFRFNPALIFMVEDSLGRDIGRREY